MRIGRYEFGLERPIKWRKYERIEGSCGCTLYGWGFWYFTILRYECAGEPELAEILGPVIGPRIIGKTVSMRGKDGRGAQRSREILHYLKNTTEKVTDYIILDDDADMNGVAAHWWKCNCYDGMSFLTYADLNQYLQLNPQSLKARKFRLTNWLVWATIIVKYHCFRRWYYPMSWRIREWLRRK